MIARDPFKGRHRHPNLRGRWENLRRGVPRAFSLAAIFAAPGRLAGWIRDQYGFGLLFALEAIAQLFIVRGEAQAATDRQRGGRF